MIVMKTKQWGKFSCWADNGTREAFCLLRLYSAMVGRGNHVRDLHKGLLHHPSAFLGPSHSARPMLIKQDKIKKHTLSAPFRIAKHSQTKQMHSVLPQWCTHTSHMTAFLPYLHYNAQKQFGD